MLTSKFTVLTIIVWTVFFPVVADVNADEIEVKSVMVSLIDQVKVASEEPGVLRVVKIRAGDNVRAGDLIGELDSVDARMAIQRVQHEVEIAKVESQNQLHLRLAEKALGITEAELTRAQESNGKFTGAVTLTELDRLRLARDQAQLEIEQARHEMLLSRLRLELKKSELNIAQGNLQRRTIRSPIDGLVTKVEHQVGEWIQPGAMFCEIVQTEQVRVEGFVAVSQATVLPKQAVRVVLKIEGQPENELTGIITFIDPQIDPINQQYRVWATIDNPNGVLRPGHQPTMWVNTAIAPVVKTSDR